jgi:hypothetical protein
MTYADIRQSTYSFWRPQDLQNAAHQPLTLKMLQDVMNSINSAVYDAVQYIVVSPTELHLYCDLLREEHAAHMAMLARGAMHILGDTTPHMTDTAIQQWRRPYWPEAARPDSLLDKLRRLW